MLNSASRRIIAVIQAILSVEWLISGLNKLAYGQFPQALGGALSVELQDNPNDWYVAFIQQVILPHSFLWGILIEWSETLVGLALLGGALVLLGQPRRRHENEFHLGVALSVVSITAALLCIALCVNFHFWMGGSPVIPALNPGHPFDEGIDLDAILPLFALIVVGAQLHLIAELRERPFFPKLSAWWHLHIAHQRVDALSLPNPSEASSAD